MRRLFAHALKSAMAAAIIASLGGCPVASNEVAGIAGVSGNSSNSASTQQDNQSAFPAPSAGSGATDDYSASVSAKYPSCSLPASAANWDNQVLALVNQEREAVGVNPVVANTTLAHQAEEYACEMIAQNFFDHVNPVTGSTLKDRAAQFQYSYYVIGENLAAGQQSPAEVMAAWMNSPEHKANILDPRFTQLGVSVRTGGSYGVYWVQEFGEPQ